MKTLLLLLFPTLLLAQDKDLIISKSFDTISCTISKVSKSSLYYTQNNGNTKILALNKINTYYLDGTKKESGDIIADCKYLRDEIDKFTKDIVKETGFNRLCYKGVRCFNYAFKKINESRYLKFSYVSPSIYSVDDGAKLMLLMDDESIVILNVIEGAVADYFNSIWYAPVYLSLSDDNYNLLLNSTINSVRYYTRDGYVDLEVKIKNSRLFRYMLRCI